MSTRGIAHHQSLRGGVAAQAYGELREAETLARRASAFAAADAAYRDMLGLNDGEPLPARLGSCVRGGGRPIATRRRQPRVGRPIGAGD